MKKDIEWLRKDFDRIFNHNIRINSDKEWDKGWNFGWYEARATVYALTIQLDESEVLSQEWIDENKSLINGRSTNPDGTEGDCYDAHYIHVLELQNLLVPTLSEMETVEITEEPETVSDVVADFYESCERLQRVMSMKVEETEE